MNASDDFTNSAEQPAESPIQSKANRLDKRLLVISGKFRRRSNPSSGYHSLDELWTDLYPCIELALSFEPSWSMQYMLRITGEFHDYCVGFGKENDVQGIPPMFRELEKAWLRLLEVQGLSTTDKIRSLNIFRDGKDKAEWLGIGEVYQQAMQAAAPVMS
ncbi:hypothetical protein NQZ79_g5463 [Umbelopsis isabellina]|nr:hypothetical protein NQZ79_g5463 [Umbelopsis isabellina]